LLQKLRSVIDLLPNLRLIVCMDALSGEEYDQWHSDFGTSRCMVPLAQYRITNEEGSSDAISSAATSSVWVENGKPTLCLVSFTDLVAIGEKCKLEAPNLQTDEISTIVYTSGSTGRPKGAVNSFARWNNFITYIYNMPMPLIRLSFMPLAHNTERQQSHLTMTYGGKMCFSRGDMGRIFEEFALVNPTSLSAAPRFYDSIYNQYQATLSQFRKDYPEVMLSQAEAYCLNQYRGILGNAMQVLVVGGAAVSPFTKEFIIKCFGIPVFDGYGTTEAGGITADGHLYPGTEVKIIDCPELGYTSQDKPWPRGEVWAKTTSMVSGYYKDQATTDEFFKDGWFITGDIVEVRNGCEYYIIDRRKNLFKLSQGVFVAPSAIENKLLVSDFVHQIYVYGDHTRSNLVAVVVPNLENLAKWCQEHQHLDILDWCKQNSISIPDDGSNPSSLASSLLSTHFESFAPYLCALPIANAKVHQEIINTAKQIDLPPYHTPAAITLEHEKWTTENRLVTPSDKPQRAALEKKYSDALKRMYEAVAIAQNESNAMTDQVRDLMGEFSEEDSVNSSSSADGETAPNLATDSLSVLKLIHTLNQKFNTNLSFMDIMRETGGRLTPQLIAEVIQRRSSASPVARLDSWSLHDPSILSDLDIAVTVPENLVTEFYATVSSSESEESNFEKSPLNIDGKTILVTGATGFLGFHLLAELLSKYPNSKFIVLVRAASDDAAKLRVVEETATRQRRTFDSQKEMGRMEFLAGDLAKPLLGLNSDAWAHLEESVDAIFHVGAVVNWMWGYTTMRETNVLGTVELLKLATSHHLKFFYFVSTASTSNGVALIPGEPSSQLLVQWEGRGPLEETSTMRRDEAAHRSAYVISKWVAETIVKRSIQLGLPGCILRPGMITGHSESGACHPTDFSPRLLIGLAQSGTAFSSDLPLEWMPVDFCAKAIIGLASHFNSHILPVLTKEQAYGVVPSFNIQNYQTATYSKITSYLASAGIALESTDYKKWRASIAAHPTSPLWPLLPFFGEDECHMYAVLMPAPQTFAILNQMGIICPPADEKLFHTYVRYLRDERLI
jgi:fatty acid CoA ligase FadD9